MPNGESDIVNWRTYDAMAKRNRTHVKNWSIKHYKENKGLNNTNPIKRRVNTGTQQFLLY